MHEKLGGSKEITQRVVRLEAAAGSQGMQLHRQGQARHERLQPEPHDRRAGPDERPAGGIRDRPRAG